MTAAAIPYIVAGGGALLQYKAQNDAADKQKSILNASTARAKKIGDANRSLAIGEANKYNVEDRAVEQAAVQDKLSTGYQNSLIGGENPADNSNQGNVSADFAVGNAKGVADRTASGIAMSKLLSKMRAPQQLRLDEAVRGADVASRIGEGNANINNVVNAGQIDASGVRPDGMQTLIGGLAQSYGVNSALGKIGKTPGVTGKTSTADIANSIFV